jgi:hypothetical protein
LPAPIVCFHFKTSLRSSEAELAESKAMAPAIPQGAGVPAGGGQGALAGASGPGVAVLAAASGAAASGQGFGSLGSQPMPKIDTNINKQARIVTMFFITFPFPKM